MRRISAMVRSVSSRVSASDRRKGSGAVLPSISSFSRMHSSDCPASSRKLPADAAALFFLYPRLPTTNIVGSDIAHAVPLTLVAGLGHAHLGTVDWSLLGSLLVGSLPGIWIGSHLSARVPERLLRSGLASLLILIGGKLVL